VVSYHNSCIRKELAVLYIIRHMEKTEAGQAICIREVTTK